MRSIPMFVQHYLINDQYAKKIVKLFTQNFPNFLVFFFFCLPDRAFCLLYNQQYQIINILLKYRYVILCHFVQPLRRETAIETYKQFSRNRCLTSKRFVYTSIDGGRSHSPAQTFKALTSSRIMSLSVSIRHWTPRFAYPIFSSLLRRPHETRRELPKQAQFIFLGGL